MTASHKTLLLVFFMTAAILRITVGVPPPTGPPVALGRIVLPNPPLGWSIKSSADLTGEAGVTGKTATYRAPDGSTVTLFCRAAWPDRRNIPGSFYPDDCNYLGQGWDFEVRGANLSLGPGATANRILVHKETVRLLDLSAYACEGEVIGSWHEFKTRLIWQRIRRARKPWIKAAVIGLADTGAAARAQDILFQAAARSSAGLK